MISSELKKILYELTIDDKVPVAGEYLVTIGKQGRINSIYLIKAVRAVVHRKPETTRQDYALHVVAAQEAKPLTEYDLETGEVWVQGEEAHGLVWNSRGKQQQKPVVTT